MERGISSPMAVLDTSIIQHVPSRLDQGMEAYVRDVNDQHTLPHVTSLRDPALEHACEEMLGDADVDAFVVIDAAFPVRKFQRWSTLVPRVKPHFAVKCNPNPVLLKSLCMISGCGFDCASIGEIKQVLANGVSPNRIIFANPCKAPEAISYALINGVATMTFDSENELQKIRAIMDNQRAKDVDLVEPKLVIRLKVPDSHSVSPLGEKFGADVTRLALLLAEASRLNFNVIGISFHCGSGCYDAIAYVEALRVARQAFDIATTCGFSFWLLDIGGGYPGYDGSESLYSTEVTSQPHPLSLMKIAESLNPTLDSLFPASSGVKVISEPGRYFVEGSNTLYVCVFARREMSDMSLVKRLLGVRGHSSYHNTATEDGEPETQTHTPEPVERTEGDENETWPAAVFWYVCEGGMGCFKDVILCQAEFPFEIADHLTHRDTHAHTYTQNDTSGYPSRTRCSSYPDHVLHVLVGLDGTSHTVLAKDVKLDISVGCWLRFDRFGAYTTSIASDYASLAKKTCVYVWTDQEA